MTPPDRLADRLRRLIGPRDSWRRIVLTGATAGVTLAVVAALVAGLVRRGGGSLDDPTPTAPAPGPVDSGPADTLPPAIETVAPTETPVEAPPEEPTPTEVPPEPTPTIPAEPTPTLEGPTAEPTGPLDGLLP